MAPNASDSLLPQVISVEKTPVGEIEDEEPVRCDNQELAYGAGDAVITVFIVAPLVVTIWRGTWGIMELHPTMFPYVQIFVLGIIIHVCFALVRSHLLSRCQSAWGPDHRAGRWLRERVISRVYTYIFIISNIMHWRGGWGLLDWTVAAIVPNAGDPHRPVLYAAFTIVFYITIVSIRSARNLLAAPYFLFTDGKEATYIFTTRFQKKSCGDRGCVHTMRGSTAGLTDTLSGPGPVVLGLADVLFASLVVAPAVVTYWKSTWSLLDIYLMTDPVASAALCAGFGLSCDFLFCVFQTQLSKYLRPERSKLAYYVLSRLCTCIAGVACVGAWRGVWNLLNECTGDSAKTIMSTTVAATLSLAALRTLRNICAAPFAVAVDSPKDYFDVPTMFRTSSRETALYILDCVFSVTVVGSLVVFVWRGSWALLDIFLYPDDQVKSCWTSLIVGYAIVVITFGAQAPMRWAVSKLQGAPRLLVADVYHLVSFIATVNVWRGIWGLLDIYFYPESPKLSNWCSHIVSLALLILLNCSNSVLVRGVYIDAEEPAGDCVVFPCHYLRLYFHKERVKKRHKGSLANNPSKVPEEASVPLQIPEEKV